MGQDVEQLSLSKADSARLADLDILYLEELDMQFLRELASIHMTQLDSLRMARWYAPRKQTPVPISTLPVPSQAVLMPSYVTGPPSVWLIDILAELAKPDTTNDSPWETDVVSKIGGSQAGYRNWAKGGVNTLALTTGVEARTVRKTEYWEQKHEVKFGYGLVKQDTLPIRKADDEIRLQSSLQHKGDDFFRHFDPTVAVQARTQFASGYNYKKNPFKDDGREPPVRVSDIFSPLVLTQSIGLSYEPENWFSQRLGIGSKQTIVAEPRFRELYGVDSTRVYQLEVGVESRTQLDREVFDNVRLKSTLGLFAAFNNPDLPDMQWENLVSMKVNRWLGVNLQLDALYDRDISNRVQVKEVFSLGFSFTLI